MTVPFETQGRYVNEIEGSPHWYCTLRKDRAGRLWVSTTYSVVCGMFGCVDSC